MSRLAGIGFGAQLAAIAAAALLVRLVYVAIVGDDLGPGPTGDIVYFHEIANLLADGRGHINPYFLMFEGRETATAEHPPLWPLLLAAASELGGNGIVSHRLVAVPIGAAVVMAVGVIGRRVGGDRVGLAAAGIAAAYPILIGADGSMMSETLYGLLLALALLAGLRLLERPTAAQAALLGALIGLSALVRGEGLLLLLLLGLPAALRGGPGRARRTAALVAAAAVVLAPWTIRNWTTFDRPVLLSTNDSTVLTGANCEDTYRGEQLGFWRVQCRSLIQTDNEAEQAATWRREGLEYARDHAGRLVVVVVPVRLLRTFGLWRPADQVRQAEGRMPSMEWAGVVAYFLLLPLAVYGAAVLRRRGGPLWVLLVPVAVVVIVSVTAYGYTRFRHAAEIPLVVLAALGAAALWGRRADRRAAPG
jgi:4-amino-4-deoxy-L-arabinose transferase-like glycosyltransferase